MPCVSQMTASEIMSAGQLEPQNAPAEVQVKLIVTADDLGMSPERDQGIFDAFRHGIVTTASLLVNGCSAGQAGVHLACELTLARLARSSCTRSALATHDLLVLVQQNRQPRWACLWACT